MIGADLAQLLSEIHYKQLPNKVVEAAKVRLLDYIGAGLAGFHLGSIRSLMSLFSEKGQCTVIGWGGGYSLRDATVLNAFLVHSTVCEDGSRVTGGHPASAVLPAILALAEDRGCSGEELITAAVCGYECFNRIGRVLYPDAVRKGFQPTAILAPMAAAAACAKLMNLPLDSVAGAINLAAPWGAGLKSAAWGQGQPMQVARGSEAGLLAALLAEKGWHGFEGCVESFLTAHEKTAVNVDASPWKDDFEICHTYVKIHGGCRGNHAPLDAVTSIISGNSLGVDDIAEIKIQIDSMTAATEIANPTSVGEAFYSIPFSVAVLLLFGNVSLLQFNEENLADPRVHELMKIVKVDADPRLDSFLPAKRGAKAVIRVKNGRTYESFVDMPRGEPESKLSWNEVLAKFLLLSEAVLEKQARKTAELVDSLNTLESLTPLFDAVSVSVK